MVAEGAFPRCGIAIMAKASKAGRTKTRLTPAVSAEDAARFNTAFLADGADNMLAAATGASIAAYMAFGPPGEASFFTFLPPAVSLIEAWMPDFGDTLLAATSGLFAKGHMAVCLLNADSPTLPISTLVEAATLLAQPGDRLVLGPSTDGGYYLIGMKRLHRRLFEDIAWSTEAVTRQTLDRAAEIGLPVSLLHPWYDVDDAAGLKTLEDDLLGTRRFDDARPPAPARHTRALLASLASPSAPR